MTLHALTDHDLLAGGLAELIAENKAAACRSARLVEFHRRLLAREGHRTNDHFSLTAREETTLEISELWAVPASWVRRHLNDSLWIHAYFPRLQELAEAGAIDPYRIRLIAETARHGLDTDAEYALFADRMQVFLLRHLRPDGIVACTHKQLRNKLAYTIKVLRAADAEQRFRRAHANRDVTVNDGEDGMSWLTLAGTTDQIALAAHRLTLSARSLRAAGDPRSIHQIRADLAVDLLVAGTTEDGGAPPAYARPIINLTVPVQTVMGLADHPGALSGGQVIPASLARQIAQGPHATWHRILTDPAGQAVEISTTSYQPTPAIWEQAVALSPTCFRPGCDAPATLCDLDHRIPWPEGLTGPSNLWPACRTDHRAKHSAGFAVDSSSLKTPAGFDYTIPMTQHPAESSWHEASGRIQFSPTEIREAVVRLAAERAEARRLRQDIIWELDIREGLQYDAAA
ncbi:MAG: hypothetical protein JWR52_1284 [Marmoricola sp.]|nr:hypothetical protein [Marmoricola sp.]